MLRNRIFVLLGASFLAASAAWADDVGYVDCTNHPEDIQVFAKARKTPDVVAAVPCGERFTVLVYGFVFSRIQTKDGNVGYIYSNQIAVDRAASAVQQTPSAQLASAKVKISSTSAAVTRPAQGPAASAQPQPVQARPAQAPEPTSNLPEVTVAAAQPQSASAQPTSVPVPEIKLNVTGTAATTVQPAPPAAAQPQPAPAQPAPPPQPKPKAPETASPVAQPNRNALAQTESAPAESAAPAIRPADTRATWEKPLPGVRQAPLLELFGGFAFARMDGGGGSTSNMIGALGSFGWNVKPWLQIVGDSSYSVVTTNGTKNVLYGNHYGPRYFHRRHGRWGLTPFAEALFGGSRADTKLSGSSVYNTSVNGFSIKVGGGLDIHPSRHFDIRLFDADYYRTSFGTNVNQNNYWISTGIVLRLFGGGAE